jgi:hypothetical protein
MEHIIHASLFVHPDFRDIVDSLGINLLKSFVLSHIHFLHTVWFFPSHILIDESLLQTKYIMMPQAE